MHFVRSDGEENYSSVEHAFGALDEIFSGEWRERESEIASSIDYLRTQKRLLKGWASKSIKADSRPEMIGAQSFLVHQSKILICRINLWFPKGTMGLESKSYARYLSIDVLHNHDFNFYTTCLLGGGYISKFYISRNGAYDLSVGDEIDVEREELVHLNNGKIVFVEKGSDFHNQYWPDDFTITLNIIPIEPLSLRQYSVNQSDMRVKFVVNAPQNLKHKL